MRSAEYHYERESKSVKIAQEDPVVASPKQRISLRRGASRHDPPPHNAEQAT